jgi:hypothetical protein
MTPPLNKCYPINCPPPDEVIPAWAKCSSLSSADGSCLIMNYFKTEEACLNQDKFKSYDDFVESWCRIQSRDLTVNIEIDIASGAISNMNTNDPQFQVYVVNMNTDKSYSQPVTNFNFPQTVTITVPYSYNYHGSQSYYVGLKYKKVNGTMRDFSPNFSSQSYPGGSNPVLNFTLNLTN